MVVTGYIIDREDGSRISFKYFDDISEDVAAVWDEPTVRARSEPHLFYAQTGPDTYSFHITLAASADEYDGGTTQKLHDDYLFLKSFQFPDYGPGYAGPVRPPHQVIITIGSFFRKKGVIQSPGFTFKRPYDTKGFPQIIECRFTFRVINDVPLDYMDVRRGFGNLPPDYNP